MRKTICAQFYFVALIVLLFVMVSFAQTTVNYKIEKEPIQGDLLIHWTPVVDSGSANAQWSDDFAMGNAFDVAGNFDIGAYYTQSFAAGKSPATLITHWVCYGDPSVTTNWFVRDTLVANGSATTTPTSASGYTLYGLIAPHNKFKVVCDAAAVTVKLNVWLLKQQIY